ncbi:hypothetical protein ABE056_07680 [Priestia aryabhattai]|uniref:hypothetical protein n=1 Tax=Priestia aryabhattai TaxID=412384 RepID=UPI003D295EBB
MRVLFAESEKYYFNLGVLSYFKEHETAFNGVKKYKKDKEIKSYDLVVSYLFHSPISNFLILKAKQLGVKTLFICDGIFDWANAFDNPIHKNLNIKQFHPIIHDFMWCIGEEEKKYFDSQGVVGLKYLPKRVFDYKKVPINKTKTVLITTANTPYFNEKEKESLISLIKEIASKLDSMQINYIFRIFNEDLKKELKIPIEKNFIDGSFDETLALVDSVITTPSSIILPAMYNERSVGMMVYRDTPLFLQSGWLLHKSTDLENTLNSLMLMDSDRMNFQRYQLKRYINDQDISSTNDNIEQFLARVEIRHDKNEFINTNMYNMLNSKFNLNIEFFIRSLYLKAKKLFK